MWPSVIYCMETYKKKHTKRQKKIFLCKIRSLPDCWIPNPSTSTSCLKSNKKRWVESSLRRFFFQNWIFTKLKKLPRKRIQTLCGQNTLWDDNTGFHHEFLSRHYTYVHRRFLDQINVECKISVLDKFLYTIIDKMPSLHNWKAKSQFW